MTRSSPKRPLLQPGPELAIDVSTGDLSGLAQTAEFELRGSASQPAIDAHARYQVLERLGAGGFGVVFKAWDAELERTVAIKLVRPGAGESSTAALLAEARILARLDHPAIVPVYDLGRTPSDDLLIVSKFVDGRDLGKWLKSQRMSPAQAASCIATIAEALDYAHAQGIVHRDVKPGNILLSAAGEAVLSDFGLALHDTALGSGSHFVGTPAYMSPEQARHEGHRVDGRSDIYSLGTVFYELLTGSRPFPTKDRDELLDYIRNVEARPPRQLDRNLPKELERICLKALCKRPTDRYLTAGDMASELRLWLAAQQAAPVQAPGAAPTETTDESASVGGAPAVVPHGLRSFDESDADFFLHLLPGARDREGVPESVRFWKRRIESTDPGEAFRVGVLLGPSGSGKSSLLRAGVVPLLDDRVQVIVVEASPTGFEERLRRRIAREVASGDEALQLHDLAVRIRQQGPGRGKTKLLIVIDQFEQWLNVNDGEPQTMLGETLRQCDGVTLQALLLVRDDFTLAITRFLEELEEPLLQNRNFAAIDLFSTAHAAKVLESFGRAYRAWEGEPSRENQRFIDEAVQELAQGGRIVPVQLAALAEMVKERPWTEATLRQLGGMQGVEVEFLEQRLVGPRSHPEIRQQLPAVRRLLQALLPPESESIRGPAKTKSELVKTLADVVTPQRLDKLLLLLDVEVRLITPVRSAIADSTDSDSSQREAAYQLTHDYLVSAIRAWLTASQRSTRSGRARLRLKELAETWNARPSPQRLPLVLEWLSIRTLTRPAEWTAPERRLMQAAGRRIIRRTAMVVGALLVVALGLWQVARQQRAEALYARLLAADTSEVPAIVGELAGYPGWAEKKLRLEEKTDLPATSEQGASAFRRKLHKQLALAASDPAAAAFVVQHLDQVAPEHLAAVIELLKPERAAVIPLLWQHVAGSPREGSANVVLPAASLLASYDGDNPAWPEVAPRLVRQMIAGRSTVLIYWLKYLFPCRAVLIREMLAIIESSSAALSPSERGQLFESLAVLAEDDPASLATALERAEREDMLALWPAVQRRPQAMQASLQRRFDHWTRRIANSDQQWLEPSAQLAAEVRRWSGSIDRPWAYVAACPRDEFDALAANLKSAGYAPLTIRPFAARDQMLVAASFDRAARSSQWQFEVPEAEIASRQRAERAGGWRLTDFAFYPSSESANRRLTLLWEKATSDEDDDRLLIGAGIAEFKALTEQLKKQRYLLQRCSSTLDEAGHIAYSALWQRHGTEASCSHRSRYASAFGELYPGSTLADVRLHPLNPAQRDPYSATTWFEECQQQAESALTDDQRQKAQANMVRYALAKGAPAAALESSGHLKSPQPVDLVRRGIAAARLDNSESLKQAIADLEAINPRLAVLSQLRVRLAMLEDRSEELPKFIAGFKESSNVDNEIRQVQCMAVAAGLMKNETLSAQASQWRGEAIGRLDRLLSGETSAPPEQIVFDPDFDSLRAEAAFQDILRKHKLSRRYDGVWQERKDFETRLLFDVGAAEHERLAKQLAKQHYQVACLDVKAEPPSGQLVMASIWRREVSKAEDRIQAARAIARLAAASARLGTGDWLSAVLQDQHSREARSQLIDIAPQWLATQQLLDLLATSASVTLQRSLLLAIGGAAPVERASEPGQRLRTQLDRLSASASDASLLAAAVWCGKQWQLEVQAPSAAAMSSLSFPASGARNWYRNSLGQTMVVLDPPAQYLMGSPRWEVDRNDTQGAEQLHWQQIGRRFSIAATETTVALFKEFQDDPRIKKEYAKHPFSRAERYAPTAECPQTSVRWYDAARFCQWLSERERLPEAEWCFPSIWNVAEEKWQLPANMLERRGYRLPTEAEWEFACRGDSTAATYFGDDRRLLPSYAWYLTNADEQSHAVGLLRPNDYGLFDMLGNVHEWCHDLYGNYEVPQAGYLFRDQLDDRTAPPGKSRALRGGSFETVARQLRSADRSLADPAKNQYLYGFRVARTEGPQNELPAAAP